MQIYRKLMPLLNHEFSETELGGAIFNTVSYFLVCCWLQFTTDFSSIYFFFFLIVQLCKKLSIFILLKSLGMYGKLRKQHDWALDYRYRELSQPLPAERAPGINVFVSLCFRYTFYHCISFGSTPWCLGWSPVASTLNYILYKPELSGFLRAGRR